MQFGQEGDSLVSMEDEELLLAESSSFAQEITVRQKQKIRIMYKILFILFISQVSKETLFEGNVGPENFLVGISFPKIWTIL